MSAAVRPLLIGGERSWTVTDTAGLPIVPAERYLAFLRSDDRSPNTVRSLRPRPGGVVDRAGSLRGCLGCADTDRVRRFPRLSADRGTCPEWIGSGRHRNGWPASVGGGPGGVGARLLHLGCGSVEHHPAPPGALSTLDPASPQLSADADGGRACLGSACSGVPVAGAEQVTHPAAHPGPRCGRSWTAAPPRTWQGMAGGRIWPG